MRSRIREEIDEGSSPMFPRLHVRDADKGGPKAPPRNKMAMYEQFNITSQNLVSGSSTSMFPLPLKNSTLPTSFSHVGNSQSIQFCTSNAPFILAERIQAYNSRKINITKLTLDKNSPKALDCEDVFITSSSTRGKNSGCSIIHSGKDKDSFALSCSLRSLSSLKEENFPNATELKSTQYGKSQMLEHIEVSRIGQNSKEGPPQPLDGLGDMVDASLLSLVKGKNAKLLNKEHRALKEEIRLNTLQGSNVHIYEDHTTFGDKINISDHHIEDPPVELAIGRKCFLDKGDGNEDESTHRNSDVLNKASSECTLGMDFSLDNVVGVIGEKQFWKVRRMIMNQQRIFVVQVFELHRLIKVQRLIAGSPHILFEDNHLLSKPPQKTSTANKLQHDFVSEQSSSVANKFGKASTNEHDKFNAIEKIPIPYINNNMMKNNANDHHLGNFYSDMNFKQSSSYIYPPPGNQWLVPVMSPSEGLIYKPIMGPCLPNSGFMTPIYGTYGTMSFNSGSKDNISVSPNSHQKFGSLSSSSLPQFLPPPFMHPSALVFEQMGQSNGVENHQPSSGEANSAIMYQSLSNISSHTSQVMSRNVSTYHHSLKDKELQRSTASSQSKRMKGDVLPLFPVAPTLDKLMDTQLEQQPRVIKAMPHNAKSAGESAARIFESIQEERNHL